MCHGWLWGVAVICAMPVVGGAMQRAGGQAAERFEIAGKVMESGLNRGIGGAGVVLERYEGDGASSLAPRVKLGEAETDSAGAFRFAVEKAGSYRIEVRKEGYRPGGPSLEGLGSGVTVSLDEAHRRRELRFALARPAQVTGVVVEKETQAPVAGLRVYAKSYSWLRGKLTAGLGESAMTDSGGRFVVEGLSPGDYVILAGPRMQPAEELERSAELRAFGQDLLLTKFSEEDLDATDLDYDWTYWPGGGGLEQAVAIRADSGARLDAGKVEVRKSTMYRARVDLTGGACEGDERIAVHIRRVSSPWLGTKAGQVRCGSSFLVRGLAPGAYRMEVGGAAGRAAANVTITDKNVSVSVGLERGVLVEGKVTVQGSTALDVTQIRLLLRPLTWAVLNGPVTVDGEGRFRVERVMPREYQLLSLGIPASHCLRSVSYNGARVDGDNFALNPYAVAHSLELVVDDQAAAIAGAVWRGERPVSRPWVVLARWPPGGDVFAGTMTTAGDEDGRFGFVSLVPGEYRIAAVPMEAKGELERPNVLERLMRSAEKITLGGKQTLALQVKASAADR